MSNSIEKKSVKMFMLSLISFGLMIVAAGSASAQQNCGDPKDDEVIVYENVFTHDGGGKCKVVKVESIEMPPQPV